MKMKKRAKVKTVATSFALSGLLAFGGSYWMVQEHKKDVQIELSNRDNRIALLSEQVESHIKTISNQDNDIKSLQNFIREQDGKLQESQANLVKLQQEKDELQKKLKTYEDRNESPSVGLSEGGRILSMVATAYTSDPSENGGTYGGRVLTKTGYDITDTIYYQGYRVIATDPNMIPLHSIVRITLKNGQSFKAISLDTGGAIKGNIIDYLVGSNSEAIKFGRQKIIVQVLREGKGE